jgi:hypothetical protein
MKTALVPRLLVGSPSLEDGHAGARDARLLAQYDYDQEIGEVHVQSGKGTRDLLRRAGYPRTFAGAFYSVKVLMDDFNRLQISPPSRS